MTSGIFTIGDWTCEYFYNKKKQQFTGIVKQRNDPNEYKVYGKSVNAIRRGAREVIDYLQREGYHHRMMESYDKKQNNNKSLQRKQP